MSTIWLCLVSISIKNYLNLFFQDWKRDSDTIFGRGYNMYTYNAKVIRILDGDTVEAELDLGFGVSITRIVRMNGIDTPEKTSSILTVRELAAKATARAKYALENKKVILKTQLDKGDKYGRVLAYIYESQRELDADQSFNLKLIQEGLAFPYDGGKKIV